MIDHPAWMGMVMVFRSRELLDQLGIVGQWPPVDRKRLANTPPRFFQLAAWCPPVFGGHHFKPLAEDLPCQANAAP
ncbi:hypothetical protein ABZR54_27180, partial [Pseudomonas aeruginosa]